MGLPLTFLALGLAMATISHAAFGALGGVLAALLLRQLRRIPYFTHSTRVDSPSPGQPRRGPA
jgi:hypothetical protein